MFCRNCGQENEDGTKFCTGCGAALGEPPAAEVAQSANQNGAWGTQGAEQASGQPGWGIDQGGAQDAGWGQGGSQTEAWYQAEDFSNVTYNPSYGDDINGGVVPDNGGQRSGLGALAIVMVIVASLCVVAVGAFGTMYVMKLGPFAEEAVEETTEGGDGESGNDSEGERESGRDGRDDRDDRDDDKDDDFVSVPSVLDADGDEAIRELELLGFDVVIQEEHSSSVAEGAVISQSISGGDVAEPGDTIVLTVSLGPEMMTVSRYTLVRKCLTWEQARQWCEDNGHKDWLDLWDYEKNEIGPESVSYGSSKKFWFLCPRRLHESKGAHISNITRGEQKPASGEPNNEGGNENYVTLLKVNNRWSMYDVPNDVSNVYASSKIAFVMETEEQVPVS